MVSGGREVRWVPDPVRCGLRHGEIHRRRTTGVESGRLGCGARGHRVLRLRHCGADADLVILGIVTGIVPTATAVFAAIFVNDKLSARQWSGVALAAVAVTVISLA